MSFGMLLGFSIAYVLRSLCTSSKKETMLNSCQGGRIAPESEGQLEFVETEVSSDKSRADFGRLYVVKEKKK